jgi:hypothetical protein
MAFNSTEEAKGKIAATVRPYDKTCRLQSVEMNAIRLTTSSINWSYFTLI